MPFLTSMDDHYLLLHYGSQQLEPSHRYHSDVQAMGIFYVPTDGDPKQDAVLDAVVVYERFTATSCEMGIQTAGNKRWATPANLRQIFGHAFDVIGLLSVEIRIQVNNRDSMVLCTKLGFNVVGGFRTGKDGDPDVCLMAMTRKDCRWLSEKALFPTKEVLNEVVRAQS